MSSETLKYTDFLKPAIKASRDGLQVGAEISRNGLGCMDARDFAINMQLARNVDLIIREAQRRIELEVEKAENTKRGEWYPALTPSAELKR